MNRIVITGASSRIGQAIVGRLVKPGDHAILHGFRNADGLKTFITDDRYGDCEIITADFADPAALRNLCKTIKDTDILINAAAYTKADLLPALDDQDITRMIAVNIRAIVEICQAVIPGMMVRRRGIIINISSIAAQRGNRGQTVYAGTKGFVEAFTRSLAAEYGGRGIRANIVAPGAIDAGSLKELLAYAPDEVKQSISTGTLGTPEDVAAAVAFLASEDARNINGKCIPVDGGFMRGI